MNQMIKILLCANFALFIAGCGQKNTDATSNVQSEVVAPAAQVVATPPPPPPPANLEEVKVAAANGSQDAKDILDSYSKAERGNSEGEFYMGIYYYDGVIIKQNVAEAQKWFKKAADKHNAKAYWFLGRISQFGMLGPVDLKQARVWYKKSADAQIAEGIASLKELDGKK